MGNNSSKEAPKSAEAKNTRFSQPVPVPGEDYSKPLPYEKLPKKLQEIVDNEESLWDSVYEGQWVISLPGRHSTLNTKQ